MTLYRPPDGSPAICPLPACTPRISAPTGQRSAFPRVFRRGGSQLAAPELVLLFDRDYPNPDPSQTSSIELYALLADLVAGPFAEGLRQYGAGPGRVYTYDTFSTDQAMTTSQAADAFLHLRDRASEDPNTLYLFFPAPGAIAGQPGFQYGVDFCAYHTAWPDGAPYAVIPHPTLTGCRPSIPDLDILAMLASHELAEAMTDAIPGRGYTTGDQPELEIDDFYPCLWAGVRYQFLDPDGNPHSRLIQAYWDDANQRCWFPP